MMNPAEFCLLDSPELRILDPRAILVAANDDSFSCRSASVAQSEGAGNLLVGVLLLGVALFVCYLLR
jgi:hypothetical protein